MENKTLKQSKTLKNPFKTLYDASIYLLLFEIIYKGLILVLFKTIRTGIVYLFVRARSYGEVINQQLPKNLLNIAGGVLTLAAVLLFIALIYYEITVILMILEDTRKNEKTDLSSITRASLLKVKTMIADKKIGLAVYLLILAPILNIGIQLSIFPALSIPTFLNKIMDKVPGSRIILVLSAFSLVYLFVKLFIVLPIVTFTDHLFKEASKLSFEKIKGKSFILISLVSIAVFGWIIISRMPFLVLSAFDFRLPRWLKSLSNISIALFTLSITPLILSISLGKFNQYEEFRFLTTKKPEEGFKSINKTSLVWTIIEKILTPIERLAANLSKYKAALIVLTLIGAVGLNLYGSKGLRPIAEKQLIIGHRGGEYGVENTVDTLLFSGREGSDYVEMDVLLTKDNVPVVIHDNNLKRLAETAEKISDLEINEVEDITIESEGKTENKKEHIPTLRELAKASKGKINLMLEFKLHGKEKESVVDKTMEILEEEGILEDTIFQTAEYEVVEEFNEKHEDKTMGYIYKSKKKSVSIKKALETPVDFISAKGSKIDKRMVRQVHKAKKPIYAWTINDVYEAERLLNFGVDGIITDHPIEMIELLDRYNK